MVVHHARQLNRRRVRHTFVRWLRHERHRLAFPPRMGRRGRELVLRWRGLPDSVYTTLDDEALCVVVDHAVGPREVLYSQRFFARPFGDCYECGVSKGKNRTGWLWPSKAMYWMYEVFEPWMTWVNEELAKAFRRALKRRQKAVNKSRGHAQAAGSRRQGGRAGAPCAT